jgi:hypothetical protein
VLGARLGLSMVLSMGVAAGCGGSGDTNAEPTTTQTTAQAFSDYQGLEKGRTYTTTAFKPPIRFTVPRGGWSSEEGDMADDFAVAVHDPPNGVFQAILGVHRVRQVYDPKRGGTIPGDRVRLRGSFADWLRAHPRLRILADRPVKLMGLDGDLIDVTGKSQPPRVPPECGKTGPDCAPLFYAGLDPVVYARTTRGRFIVLKLPNGGELAVEQFVEPRRAFARGLRLLRPLLDRLSLAES